MTAEQFRELELAATALGRISETIMRADGDRDHMNPSDLTCEQTQNIARLVALISKQLEFALLTSGVDGAGGDDMDSIADKLSQAPRHHGIRHR